MLKLINSPTPTIKKHPKNNVHDVVNERLRLVVSNPSFPPSQKSTITSSNLTSCFDSEVHVKGPNLYGMSLQDQPYSLKCDLILEVEDAPDDFESGTVICHFPIIEGDELNSLVEEDETLFGMIMIQFQMKIMEQLLLFCGNHSANTLVIYTDDVQAEELEIYYDFLGQKDQVINERGEVTELIIPSHREAFDNWIDFMDEVNLKFRQTLWSEQSTNPTIREYLKYHPLG